MIDIKTGNEMTRRDFIGGGIAAASTLGIAGSANATVRHGLGARLAANFGGGSAWVNPYIADGLVAMWDGEWNAGGGVHDASATTWKDLVGNYDLVASSGTWSNDSFIGGTYAGAKSSTGPYKDLCNARTLTMEYCLVVPSGNSGVAFKFNASAGNTNAMYSADGVPLKWLRIHEGLNGTSGHLPSTEELATCVINVSSLRFWVNGVDKRNVSYTSSSSAIIANTDMEFSINMTMHSIRFYNRSLSADEISANYAVDAARFGIT